MSKNFSKDLPERFVRNTIGLCGKSGEHWLRTLPQIIEKLAESWSLAVDEPFSNLSYNFVAPCLNADGGRAVLKIALPLDNPEIFSEAEFLNLSGGRGTVKLLKLDRHFQAILLENLTPGRNLKEIFRENVEDPVDCAITVFQRILKEPPANSEFLKLDDWFSGLDKSVETDFPAKFSAQAKTIFEELMGKEVFLLHGDLHHENILSAEREPFLAIDPKGIIGPIGYEIAVFLNNHLWWLIDRPDLQKHLDVAVRKFSDAFQITPKELKKWAFAQIVLSAWWTFEENNENWANELAFTEFWNV